MRMQAKGTTDYKSGFTFAFEQLLNVRAKKPLSETAILVCLRLTLLSNPIKKTEFTAITQRQGLYKTFPEGCRC